ncbi:MAG: hypothetical protein HYV02_03575 [Deltaproteobacteria bacterium]|nr:hypothetical protein [Deltaproteobacteria bacterium]
MASWGATAKAQSTHSTRVWRFRQRPIGVACSVALLLLPITATAWARPPEGFHEGPYLQLVTGARNADFDTNTADGIDNARDIEPLFGFNFGWNLTDPLAFELSGHYSTSGTANIQQHLVMARVGTRWNFVTNALTHFSSVRILPYVTMGGVLHFNILPAASGSSKTRVEQWGGGMDAGGGVSLLFYHDTLYISAEGTAGPIRRSTIRENIGGSLTTVYRGGWAVDWGTRLAAGVHF